MKTVLKGPNPRYTMVVIELLVQAKTKPVETFWLCEFPFDILGQNLTITLNFYGTH